jgi:hypothetical protein
VQLHIQFVQCHPILEIAIQPIGFLDQYRAHGAMRLEIGHHLAERGAASLFGRLYVHVFLRHLETLLGGIFPEQL